MGWDAFSSIEKHYGYLQSGRKQVFIFPQKHQLDAFRRAHRRVAKLAGVADWYLEAGALDCSGSGRMLQKATGEDCLIANDINWSKRKVQALAKKANWDFKYNKDEASFYWSARLFLETCAKLRLSIYMGH